MSTDLTESVQSIREDGVCHVLLRQLLHQLFKLPVKELGVRQLDAITVSLKTRGTGKALKRDTAVLFTAGPPESQPTWTTPGPG